MSQDDGKRVRTWQEIAEEASRERNPEKLLKLSEELDRALEERDGKKPPQSAQRRPAAQSVSREN